MNNINEYIDQHRWLLNNGLITDSAKNNLYLYGAIINKSIFAVELSIDTTTKNLNYTIYVTKQLLMAYNRYHELKSSTSLFTMWRLKRMLKKHGNLEFHRMLDSFVKTYCGPTWGVSLSLKEKSEYENDESTPVDGAAENKQPVL